MARLTVVGWVGLLSLCAACASKSEPAPVAKWEGSAPHFHLAGSYGGEEMDLAIQGGDAKNLATLSCKREYHAPLIDGKLDVSKANFWEVKLEGLVTVKGERRSFELEFKRQDFTKLGAGTITAVIPRDDNALPGPGQFWFEWEWHDAKTGDTLDERAAQEGSFVLGEMTGKPDANGIIPDDTGTFGGFLTAKWSESETVTFSFTALCATNTIESDE